jgi:hypothetical protein
MDPNYLAILTSIGINRSRSTGPQCLRLKDMYYQMYRGQGAVQQLVV